MKKQIIRTIVAWLTLIGFMAATRPSDLPVVMLVIPFVVLFAALLFSGTLMGSLYRRYLAPEARLPRLPHFGATLSAGAVVLLVMQSLNQLSVKDVGTITAIMVIGYVYAVRNQQAKEVR